MIVWVFSIPFAVTAQHPDSIWIPPEIKLRPSAKRPDSLSVPPWLGIVRFGGW